MIACHGYLSTDCRLCWAKNLHKQQTAIQDMDGNCPCTLGTCCMTVELGNPMSYAPFHRGLTLMKVVKDHCLSNEFQNTGLRNQRLPYQHSNDMQRYQSRWEILSRLQTGSHTTIQELQGMFQSQLPTFFILLWFPLCMAIGYPFWGIWWWFKHCNDSRTRTGLRAKHFKESSQGLCWLLMFVWSFNAARRQS